MRWRVALVTLAVGAAQLGSQAPAAQLSPEVDPPPPVQVDPGEAPEHDPSTAERSRAESLAQDPLQDAQQPAQPMAARAPAASEGRPVRLTANGAWSWYSDPRVLETDDQTYLAYVTRGGSVTLTAVRRSDALLSSTVLSRYQLRDDHLAPALLETPDGRIAAFWAGHGRAPVRYRVSTQPGSVTSMTATRALKGSGLEQANATYVQAFRMRGVTNQYHVLTRRHSDQNWVLTTSKDLVTWTKPVQLFRHSSWSVRTWPYVEAATAGWRQIHLAVTDGHPAQGIDTSLHHFTYDAATRRMATAAGTAVQRPANPRSGTLVYSGKSVDGRVRVYDLAMRRSGGPAVAFTTVDRDPTTSGYTYKWARLKGTSWETRTLAHQADYPEGIALDGDDADRAVMVTRDGAGTQVSEVSTRDDGRTWVARPVSAQPGTQRTPTMPTGTGGTYGPLWLHGTYRSYTDYETGIVGESTGRAPLQLRPGWGADWATAGEMAATVTAGVGGPGVSGVKVWLLVRKPGEKERWIRSARTDSGGSVRLAVNRFYPVGTRVRLYVPAAGEWGRAESASVTKKARSVSIRLATSWPSTWAKGGGVRATVSSSAGRRMSGVKVWLLVRKPGEKERWIRSAHTSWNGSVRLPVNRYYPRRTRVRVYVPRTSEHGSATSKAHLT